MVTNKDNRVFMSRNYRSDLIVAPCKFDVLRTSIFAREENKYLFQEHQISAGQLSANSSSTETLLLNRTLVDLHVHTKTRWKHKTCFLFLKCGCYGD